MIANLIFVEHVKLIRRQLTWVVVGMLTALVFAQALAQYLIAKNPPGNASEIGLTPEMIQRSLSSVLWPAAFPTILASVGQMGWLVVIVLFGAVTAQEYGWRTLHLWLTRGIPRGQLLAAKAAAFLLPSLAAIVLPVILVGALTAVLTVVSGQALDASQIDPLGLALGIGATALSLLPYAAVTLPLAIASRSTIAPVGGGVAFVFLEQVLVMMKTPVAPYMPSALGVSLGTVRAGIVRGAEVAPAMAAQSGVSLLSPTAAAVGAALWVLTLVGLAHWLLRRQDVSE